MNKPVVAVTGLLPRKAMDMLKGFADVRESGVVHLPDEDLLTHVANIDGIICLLHDKITDAVLDSAGDRLRVVANVAAGFDNLEMDALRSRHIVATNTPSVLVPATADLTIGLMLAITRRITEGDRLLRDGTTWRWSMDFMLGSSLQDARLGIIGFGEIGQAVAQRARAFGMQVVYHSRNRVSSDIESRLDARHVSLSELLSDSDVVSLHCPLTEQTRHLIDAQTLRVMKPSAVLINTSRGQIVNEEHLAEALRSGALAGAALDVFEHEPRVHAALLDCMNAVLTPHLGSATHQTREAMALLAVRNVQSVFEQGYALTEI